MNKGPIDVHLFGYEFSTPLVKYQGRERPDQMIRVDLVLWEVFKLSSKLAIILRFDTDMSLMMQNCNLKFHAFQ